MKYIGLSQDTQIIVKDGDIVSALKAGDVFDISNNKINEWIPVNNMKIVGYNNRFNNVIEYIYRENRNRMVDIITKSNRRIRLVEDAYCVVVDKNKNFLRHKKVRDLDSGDCIPMGKTIQIGYPFFDSNVAKTVCYLLEANGSSVTPPEFKQNDLKRNFIAEPIRYILFDDFCEDKLIGLKLQAGVPKYFQTSAGFLVCAN